jgi:nucleoside-diphosphate-sugar epimerase
MIQQKKSLNRNVIPNFLSMNEITSANSLVAMAYYDEAVGEAFNIGSGKETRISDLAAWINELTGNKAGIIYRPRRYWNKKSRLLSNIEKARRILHYEPSMKFKEGLGYTYNWFKDNWDSIKLSAEF